MKIVAMKTNGWTMMMVNAFGVLAERRTERETLVVIQVFVKTHPYYSIIKTKKKKKKITDPISKGTMYSTVYGYQNVFLGTSPQHPINMLGCSTIIP